MTPVIDRWREYTPAQRIAIAEASPDLLKRAHRRMVAERARIDFWFFLRYVIQNPILYAPLHRKIAKWLEPQNWKTLKKMLLIPRGHIKSNVVTIAWVVWEIIRNPNIRVLIASHKESDATKFMKAIQKIILSDRFMMIFPEIRPALRSGSQTMKERWSDKAMLIERPAGVVDNTVEVASFETEMTGRHYDLNVLDDIVTRKSVQQPEIIKKTRENHQLYQSLLDPGGREVVVGTRYDWSDEYGYILDNEELAKEFDVITARALPDISFITDIRSGRKKWTEADDNVLLYPRRFTLAPQDHVDPDGDTTKNKKSLTSLYVTQGAWIFSCQYMNDPVDPATATFKREAVENIWVDELPQGPLKHFRCCDLASESETDAFTAIVDGAVDSRANVYITKIFWGTHSPLATINELILGQGGPCPKCLGKDERCASHFVPPKDIPASVGFEKGPYEKQIHPFLEVEMAKDGYPFVPIAWLPQSQGGKSKDERIRGLQPWIEGGKFFVLKSCAYRALLEEELLKFPKFTRKDIIDCCAMIEHIMFPAGAAAELEQEQEDDGVPPWFKKLQLNKGGRFIGERNVMPQNVSIKVGTRAGIN